MWNQRITKARRPWCWPESRQAKAALIFCFNTAAPTRRPPPLPHRSSPAGPAPPAWAEPAPGNGCHSGNGQCCHIWAFNGCRKLITTGRGDFGAVWLQIAGLDHSTMDKNASEDWTTYQETLKAIFIEFVADILLKYCVVVDVLSKGPTYL